MKEKNYYQKIFKFALCGLAIIGLLAFGISPAEVKAKPIVIKVVQSWPKPVEWNRPGELGLVN